MPIYTYYCPACDEGVEKIAKINVRDDQVCSDCGYLLNREIDRPGLVWSPTKNGGLST